MRFAQAAGEAIAEQLKKEVALWRSSYRRRVDELGLDDARIELEAVNAFVASRVAGELCVKSRCKE